MTADLPSWPAGGDAVLADLFFVELVRTHFKIMRERKHWYLEELVMRLEYAKRAVAGKLMRWGLQRADDEAVEVYLEVSPDGKLIYEHFGMGKEKKLVV